LQFLSLNRGLEKEYRRQKSGVGNRSQTVQSGERFTRPVSEGDAGGRGSWTLDQVKPRVWARGKEELKKRRGKSRRGKSGGVEF